MYMESFSTSRKEEATGFSTSSADVATGLLKLYMLRCWIAGAASMAAGKDINKAETACKDDVACKGASGADESFGKFFSW